MALTIKYVEVLDITQLQDKQNSYLLPHILKRAFFCLANITTYSSDFENGYHESSGPLCIKIMSPKLKSMSPHFIHYHRQTTWWSNHLSNFFDVNFTFSCRNIIAIYSRFFGFDVSIFPTLLFISWWKEVINFPWFGESLKIFLSVTCTMTKRFVYNCMI